MKTQSYIVTWKSKNENIMKIRLEMLIHLFHLSFYRLNPTHSTKSKMASKMAATSLYSQACKLLNSVFLS